MRVLRKVVPKRLLLNRKKRDLKDPEDFEYSSCDEDEYDDSDEDEYEEDESSNSDESEEVDDDEEGEEDEVEEGVDDEDEQEDEDEDELEEEEEVDEEDEDDDSEISYENEDDEESIEIDGDEYYSSKKKSKRLSLLMTPKSGKFSECSVSPTRKNFFKAFKLGRRRKRRALSPRIIRQFQEDEYEEDEEDEEEDEEEDFEDEESEDNSSTVSGQSSTEDGSDELNGDSAQSSSSQQRDFFSFDDDAEVVALPKSLTRLQRNHRRRARHQNPLTPSKRIMNTLKALTPTRKKNTPQQEQIEAENAARAMEAADALGRDLEAMGFNLSCQSFLSNSTSESAANIERYGTTMQSDSESINMAAPSTVMSSRTPRNSGSPHSFKLVKSSQSGGSSGIMQSRSPLPPPTPDEISRMNQNSPKIDDKLDRKLEELQQSSFTSDDDNMSRMDRILTAEHSNQPSNNRQRGIISSERKRWFLSPKHNSLNESARQLESPKFTTHIQVNGNTNEPQGSLEHSALSKNILLPSINSPIPSPIEKTLSSVSRNSQNTQRNADFSYEAEVSGQETGNDHMSSYTELKPETGVNFGRERSGMSSTKFTGPEPPPDLEPVQPMDRAALSSMIRTIATQTSAGSHSDAEKILSVTQTMSKELTGSEQSSGEKYDVRGVNAQKLLEGKNNDSLNENGNEGKLFDTKSCDESSKGVTRCDSTIHTIHSMDVKNSPVVIEGMSFMEDKAETAIATEPSGLSQSMTTRAKIARAKLLKIVMDRKEQESLSQSKPDRQIQIPSPIPEKNTESRILHPKRDPKKRVPTPFPGISSANRRSYSRQDLRVPSPIPEIRSSKSRTLESSKSSLTRKKENEQAGQAGESIASSKMRGVLRASSYSPSPIVKQHRSTRTLMKPRLAKLLDKKETIKDAKVSRKSIPLTPFGINHVKQWILKGANKKQSLLRLKMGDVHGKHVVENSNFVHRKLRTRDKKLEGGKLQTDSNTCFGYGDAEIKCSNKSKLDSPNEKKRRVRFSLRKHSPAVSQDRNNLSVHRHNLISADGSGGMVQSGVKAQNCFSDHEESKIQEIAVSTTEIFTNEEHLAEPTSPVSNSWKRQSGLVTSPVSFKVLDNQFGWSGDRCDSVEIVVLNNLPHDDSASAGSDSSYGDNSNITTSKSAMIRPKSKSLNSTFKDKVVDQACQTSPCQEMQVDGIHSLPKQKEELKSATVISPAGEKNRHVHSKSTEEADEGWQVHAVTEQQSIRRPQALDLVKSLSISTAPTVVQNQGEGQTKSSLLTDIGKWLNPETPKAVTEKNEDNKPADVETKEKDVSGTTESKFCENTKSPSSKSSTRKKTRSSDKDASKTNKTNESPKRRPRQSPRKTLDEGFEIESRNGVVSVVKNVCSPDLNKLLRDVKSPEPIAFPRVDPIDRKSAKAGDASHKDNIVRKKKKMNVTANHDKAGHESVELTIKPNMSARSHNTKSTYSTKSKSTVSRGSQKGKKKKVDVDTTSLHRKSRSSKPSNKNEDAKYSQRKKKRVEADKGGKCYSSISTASTKKKTRGPVRSKEKRPSRIPSKLILKKTEHDDASVLTSLNSAHFTDAASIINMNFANAWDEIAKASLVIEDAINKIDTSLRNGEGNSRTHDSTIGSEVEKALTILKKHADRLGVKESDLLLAVRSDDESTIETIRRVSSTLSKQNDSATLSKRNESGTEYFTTADTNTSAVKTMTLGEEILDIFRMYLPRSRTHQ
jgi:hypothetical protein